MNIILHIIIIAKVQFTVSQDALKEEFQKAIRNNAGLPDRRTSNKALLEGLSSQGKKMQGQVGSGKKARVSTSNLLSALGLSTTVKPQEHRSITSEEGVSEYFEQIKPLIEKDKCIKCSTFSKRFIDARAYWANILVNLPKIGNISITNSVDNFIAVAKLLMDKIDGEVFWHAMNMATVLRVDLKNVRPLLSIDVLNIPNDNNRQSGGSNLARTGESRKFRDPRNDVVMDFMRESPFQGYPEQLLDYYREDFLLNLMHDSWHTLSPIGIPTSQHSERFFFFHQQLTFRYNVERWNLGMPPPLKLDRSARRSQFRSFYNLVLPWNMHPNMTLIGNKEWCTLTEKHLRLLERFENKAYKALKGNLSYYGEILEMYYHDMGHVWLGIDCAKPGKGESSLMERSTASLRDPLFFRWHMEIERMFELHRNKKDYTVNDLMPARGVVVQDIKIVSSNSKDNVVRTFWEMYTMKTSYNSTITYRRLNHEEFLVKFKITNAERRTKRVLLNIFILLEESLYTGEWYILLERVVVNLKPSYNQKIVWDSSKCSLTIKDNVLSDINLEEDSKWPCGYPHNLMLPKGVLDEFKQFKIVAFFHDTKPNVNEGLTNKPFIYCGRNPTDPVVVADPRSYGFPFDKIWQGIPIGYVLNNNERIFGQVSTTIYIRHTGQTYMVNNGMNND